jgi:hypothetical protein
MGESTRSKYKQQTEKYNKRRFAGSGIPNEHKKPKIIFEQIAEVICKWKKYANEMIIENKLMKAI